MKTFYKIPLILFLLCTAGTLWGQLPDYYSGKSTVTANGNTYKITMDHLLRIQNVNNYKMDHPYDSEGDPVPLYQLPIEPVQKDKVFTLIKNLFSKKEINDLIIGSDKDNILYLGFIVDDRSGKVLEVHFSINNTIASRAIPPEKFYYLEQQLKEILTYPHDPGSVREFHTGTGINIFLDKLYESY